MQVSIPIKVVNYVKHVVLLAFFCLFSELLGRDVFQLLGRGKSFVEKCLYPEILKIDTRIQDTQYMLNIVDDIVDENYGVTN